jgi:hypothetical protein
LRLNRIKNIKDLMRRKSKAPASADSENEASLNLYRSLWKARARQSRFIGTVYLVLSIAFIVLSFYTRYLLFEVIALVSLMLGVALVLMSLEKYVKLSILNETSASLLLSLSDILENLKIQGKAVHIPTESEVLVFVPREGNGNNRVNYGDIRETKIDETGVVMTSPGSFLKRLYERELGGLAENFDLLSLTKWLPRVLAENLKMAEKVEIVSKSDDVEVKFLSPIFGDLCNDEKVVSVCKTIGCPICISVADMLARSTGRVVFFKGCEHAPDLSQLTSSYTLGPYLGSSETKDHQ